MKPSAWSFQRLASTSWGRQGWLPGSTCSGRVTVCCGPRRTESSEQSPTQGGPLPRARSLKGPPRMLHAASNPVPLQCKVDFKCSSLTFQFSQRSAAYPSPRTLEIHAEPPRGPRPLRGVLWFVTDLSFKISRQGGGRWRWKRLGVWD